MLSGLDGHAAHFFLIVMSVSAVDGRPLRCVIFVVAILPMLKHRCVMAFAESGNAWPPSKDDKLSPRIS